MASDENPKVKYHTPRWRQGLSGATVSSRKLEELLKRLPADACTGPEIRDLLSEIVTVGAPSPDAPEQDGGAREQGLKHNFISRDIARGMAAGWLHPVDMTPEIAIEYAMQRQIDALWFRSDDVQEWINNFRGRGLTHGLLGWPALTLWELTDFVLDHEDPYNRERDIIPVLNLARPNRQKIDATLKVKKERKRKAVALWGLAKKGQITASYSSGDPISDTGYGWFKTTVAIPQVAKLFELLEVNEAYLPPEPLRQDIASAPSPSAEGDKVTPKKAPLFPSPPGLHWEEVSWVFTSDRSVTIKARDKIKRFNYSDLGFRDRRKGDSPNYQWMVLRLFSEHQGAIDRETRGMSFDPTLLKTYVTKTRRLLREIFGIEDDPFSPYSKKEDGYKLRMSIRNESDPG